MSSFLTGHYSVYSSTFSNCAHVCVFDYAIYLFALASNDFIFFLKKVSVFIQILIETKKLSITLIQRLMAHFITEYPSILVFFSQ